MLQKKKWLVIDVLLFYLDITVPAFSFFNCTKHETYIFPSLKIQIPILRHQSLNPHKAITMKPLYHLNVFLEVQILQMKVAYVVTKYDKN